MGLISAALSAGGSVLSDSWRDYFYCDSLSTDVLLTKGKKKQGKGNENIISNGSIVAVNEGQCMILVDQGQITEICAEAGEFVYDTSTEPSLFYADLGENIVNSFKEFYKRLSFAGGTAKDQRVYYINTKDIIGNKYGTVNPVPFRVVDTNVGLDMDIDIRCHGEYSYKIVDPVLFYKNIVGNVSDEFRRDKIESQLKSELLTALQPTFAKISEMGIRYSALPGHTTEIADVLNDVLSKKWTETYGIKISSFGISSVNASEEDEKTIKELQRAGALKNPNMAAATLASAQAQAMQDAAKNTATGPMMAFAGMNMAQQAAPQMAPQSAGNSWTCTCGNVNTGNFCPNCGAQRPAAGWTCSCGNVNTGNFCTNCGSPKPN